MIATKHFLFVHLGRTGGDTIANWLATLFPGEVELSDSLASPLKHSTLQQRQAWIGNRKIVCGIRRMPAWILSMAQSRFVSGVCNQPKPFRVLETSGIGATSLPDQELTHMLGSASVHHWLRSEMLTQDFVALMESVGVPARSKLRDMAKATFKPIMGYNHDWNMWFTPEQVISLYQANPHWAQLEKLAYGWIPTLAGECRTAR